MILPGSIFDLISPADKARLENIKQGGSSGQAKEAAKDESAMHTGLSDSPAGPTKPFARDEAKQKRFEQYLSLLSSKRIGKPVLTVLSFVKLFAHICLPST